ncbi:MAG: dynamin family protein, partial [Pedococcus sp.]
MSPLKRGRGKVAGTGAEDLVERSAALGDALEAGGSQLDPVRSSRAVAVIDKVTARTSKSGDHTVVALAGATGSGKSSLFNALVGDTVATVGARRPTTSRPIAAVWGDDDATDLLDWLEVAQRHHVVGAGSTEAGASGEAVSAGSARTWNLDGLVLLDLPDFDSRVEAHRLESERVLELVDVFVWVTDPQKYADARLHNDFLKVLATHDAVTVVVLNQADRLSAEEVKQIRGDLARLTAEDGIAGVQVLATSATTLTGLDELGTRLGTAVAARNAARARLAADIRATAARLRVDVADSEPSLAETVDADLVEALSRA